MNSQQNNNLILPIPSTTGYFASEDGRIYSTNYNTSKSYRLMKPRANNYGYMQVALGNNGGTFANKLCSVHRLVAITFISNPEDKPQVNHINGNKSDNRVVNLEWNTASENIRHAFENNLIKVCKGEDHPSSKLSSTETISLIQELLDGSSNEELSVKYSLHSRYVSLIRHQKRWKHIWDEYFPGKVAPNSFTDLKASTLDRDLVIKELLTTSEACRTIAERHDVDQTTLSRIRSGSSIPSVWESYVDKYKHLVVQKQIIPYTTIVEQLLGTERSLAEIAREFDIGVSALQKVRAGKPTKKWKPYTEEYIKLN